MGKMAQITDFLPKIAENATKNLAITAMITAVPSNYRERF